MDADENKDGFESIGTIAARVLADVERKRSREEKVRGPKAPEVAHGEVTGHGREEGSGLIPVRETGSAVAGTPASAKGRAARSPAPPGGRGAGQGPPPAGALRRRAGLASARLSKVMPSMPRSRAASIRRGQ